MSDWSADVLNFWFRLTNEEWWKGADDIDSRVRGRFLELWTEKRELPAASFLDNAKTALAATILFDQFPRNMFRGSAEQFATDELARAVANAAVDKGFDEQLQTQERVFLYMPFEHSESLEDQKRSLLLFTKLGDEEMLGYATKHHDVIARFGRFPHRNAMLGRTSRPDEVAAGEVVPW